MTKKKSDASVAFQFYVEEKKEVVYVDFEEDAEGEWFVNYDDYCNYYENPFSLGNANISAII